MRAAVLNALSEFGRLRRISCADEAPRKGYHVYAVLNGSDLLQIGYGSDDRMSLCMRGALAGRHAKAFICAIGETALGQPNDYGFIEVDSEPRARAIEKSIHNGLGIGTNDDAACIIAGITDDGPTSMEKVTLALWERLIERDVYRSLTSGQKAMADELVDLITWGKVIEASGRRTSRGDLLEGYMLRKIGKAHLIHVFQELTNSYLQYRSHKLPDEEFFARAKEYTYQPQRRRFEIRCAATGTRDEPAISPPRNAARRRVAVPSALASTSTQTVSTQVTALVERLPDDFPGPFDSDICGNDASNRESSQSLSKEKLATPFVLRLHWKRTGKDSKRLIGCYRLDLSGLLACGCMYCDPDGSLRLKIQHDGGDYWIRRTRNGPSRRL